MKTGPGKWLLGVCLMMGLLIWGCDSEQAESSSNNPPETSESNPSINPKTEESGPVVAVPTEIMQEISPLVGNWQWMEKKQTWALVNPNTDLFPFPGDGSYADSVAGDQRFYYNFRLAIHEVSDFHLSMETFEDRGQANGIEIRRLTEAGKGALYAFYYTYSDMVGDPPKLRLFTDQGDGNFQELPQNQWPKPDWFSAAKGKLGKQVPPFETLEWTYHLEGDKILLRLEESRFECKNGKVTAWPELSNFEIGWKEEICKVNETFGGTEMKFTYDRTKADFEPENDNPKWLKNSALRPVQPCTFKEFVAQFPELELPTYFEDRFYRTRTRKGKKLAPQDAQAWICDVAGSDRVCVEETGDENMDFNTLDSWYAIGKFKGNDGSMNLVYQEFYIDLGRVYLGRYSADGRLLQEFDLAGTRFTDVERSATIQSATAVDISQVTYEYEHLYEEDKIKKREEEHLRAKANGTWEYQVRR